MIFRGHIRNGVIVPDEPSSLPEGAAVQIEVIGDDSKPRPKRQGGIYSGQIHMESDFDEWPPDMRETLGMQP